MPRKPNIKWRESDAEKLTREVERFNAKIYRARSKHPELADILPQTIKKADKLKMVEEFKAAPRSEFNKELKSLERFSRKGAEQAVTNKEGFTVTKWERRELGIEVAQLNRERAIERKKAENMEATSRGQSLGMKRGEMGSERLNELKPKKFDFDKVRNRTEWKKLKASIEKQTAFDYKDEKNKQYKMNYIKGMTRVFGDYGEDAIRKLKQLPAELVVEVFYREQEATIDFIYEKQDLEVKLEIIEEIWQSVYGDKNNVSKSNWSIEEETEYNEWYENGY